MIKHCYNLSLKATSKSGVKTNIPDADVALQVVSVMDYIESAKIDETGGHNHIKNKIKEIYRIINRKNR